MNRIWTLAAFLTFSNPTQSSSSPTLFLITAPEVFHAGTPTPLAVTVFANFSGKVTAEVTNGSMKVAQTENFQGGLTSIFTLPPIPGPLSHNSPLSLTVKGFKENSLIFTNNTIITFSNRNVTVFIQTDKSRYKPGDVVKIRIVSIQLDNYPYKGNVDVSVQNPSGVVADRLKSAGNLGIVVHKFNLPPRSPLGEWKITTTVNSLTDEKIFVVEHQGIPPFEILVKTSTLVLLGNDISGSVRVLYPNGQPLHGTLDINVTLEAAGASQFLLTQTKKIFGSAQFVFRKDLLQPLASSLALSSNKPFVLIYSVRVTDTSTGSVSSKTVRVQLVEKTYEIMFYDFPPSLKPSLHFSAKLRITRTDKMPLSSVDQTQYALVEFSQKLRSNLTDPKVASLTFPLPKDGNIQMKFKLHEEVDVVLIRARFKSYEETLKVYANFSSPSGSYIQICPLNTSAQMGSPLEINVESTFKPTSLHFVISSKGQVVNAGSKTSSSFFLTPALSWSPEVCVTVYTISLNGEIVSDTTHISVHPRNNVSLSWSSEMAQPNEQVSLTVALEEPMFQVGITVMEMLNDALKPDLPMKEPECRIKMLTNAGFYQRQKSSKNAKDLEDYLIVKKYWNHWMETSETRLWLDSGVSDKVWTSEKITVPDGVSSLGAVALVMSENLGLSFTPVPQMLTVSKDFSLALDVPPHITQGEEIVLEINIYNHLEQNTEVIVLLAQSEAFEFVLMARKDVSVINAQKLTVGSHMSASTLFPIRPVVVGEMEISIDAVSLGATDALVRKVLVKPPGVEKSFSRSLFLELGYEENIPPSLISFSFPPNVVPGSQRAFVSLGGDILALSINNLESLVELPTDCGEQNMVNFAPSVYLLQYLDKSGQQDEKLSSKALEIIRDGYQKQLSYQREDGSFSAFGANDKSGSTWLTAFVLRCFIHAQSYIQVDQKVIEKATTWLLTNQSPQGDFTEVGELIHTEMQGGLDKDRVGLTAYVLLAFLENEQIANAYAGNVSLGLRYLESKVSHGLVSNYSLCLTAYTLALGRSSAAGLVITELLKRVDNTGRVKMSTSSGGLGSDDGLSHSTQIEMTSYLLLALFVQANFQESILLLKWLGTQRKHLGGFRSTQDTVVALQALASFATFSGAQAINLTLYVSSPNSSFVFQINSTNFRMRQTQKINADKNLSLNAFIKGRGFAIFQMNAFYNVENITSNNETFSLKVDAKDSDGSHVMLSVCTRLQGNQVIPRTGMAILEVGMLSGFSVLPGSAPAADFIKGMETTPEKVILYLNSLNKSEVCIQLPLVRQFKVAHVKDALVHVYDYYEPTRKATATYNSGFLKKIDSCFYCGENCDMCHPRISIKNPSGMLSHSISGHTFSLTFLCVVVTAFLLF